MISTIVLMGTLVTLLMVQDWQSWWWAGNNIRQNGTNFAKRNWKMMLTILGCAVAVGLVANVVKKTMNWKRKAWKKVKLCWPLWIVCWLRPAWSGPLPGTDENASRLCREINKKEFGIKNSTRRCATKGKSSKYWKLLCLFLLLWCCF